MEKHRWIAFGAIAMMTLLALWITIPNTLPDMTAPNRADAHLDPAARPDWSAALKHAITSRFATPPAPSSAAAPGDAVSVHFVTKDTGYLATSDGRILRSADGGQTWHEVFRRQRAAWQWMRWRGPFGVAAAQSGPSDSGQYAVTLAITTNAGATWRTVNSKLSLGLRSAIGQIQAYPANASTFWLLTTPQAASMDWYSPVLLSTDGGAHYHTVTLPHGFYATGGIVTRGAATWLTVAQTNGPENAVIMTADNGRSWQTVWTERTAPIYTLLWKGANQLYIAGGNIVKYQQQPAEVVWSMRLQTRTSVPRTVRRLTWIRGRLSGGAWQPIVALKSGPGGTLDALCGGNSMGANLPAPGPLLKIGANGALAGQLPVQSGTSLAVIGNRMWLTGGSGQGIGLMRSTDGGKTWRSSISPRDVQVWGVQFVSRKTGFAQTQMGQYVTTDGGRTWRPLQVNAPVPVDGSMQWVSATQADVQTANGILRSSDAGRTWQNTRMPAHTPQMYATAALPGGFFAIAYGAAPNYSIANFAVTPDAGVHWKIFRNAFGQDNVTDLTFATPALGAAYVQGTGGLGAHNRILLTAVGGAHWSALPTAPLQSVMWPLSMTAQGGLFFPANDGPTSSPSGHSLPTYVIAYRAPAGQATVYHLGLHQPTALDFVTRDDGWFASGSALYHTVDGGRTWVRVWV